MKRSTGPTDQRNARRVVLAAPAHSLSIGGDAVPSGTSSPAVPGSGSRAEAVTAPRLASMLFTPLVSGGSRL
jgi:hypothetical protein